MAALGNLALLLDITSPRTTILDRRSRLLNSSDAVLNLFKKDHHHHQQPPQNPNPYLSISTRGIESEKESTPPRPLNQRVVGVRAKKTKLYVTDDGGGGSSQREVSVRAKKSKFYVSDEVGGSNKREVGVRAKKTKFYVSDDGSDDDDYDEDDDDDDVEVVSKWEKMRNQRIKLKEVEEMMELERKAEELQGGYGDYEEDGGVQGGVAVEETEEQKRLRVKRELEKVAREQAERRKTAELMFELGQRAYERGAYGRSVEFFEGSLTIIPRPTLFGGEISIWLAMAYEANKRYDDCISLYEQLETRHPSYSIRRQAAELRYIAEAPKLKISQEEMVTIPLINSYDSYASYWTDKEKDTPRRSASSGTQSPWGGGSKDYLAELLVWRPPKDLAKNRTFWVTLVLWLGLVGAALFIQG